MTIQRTLVSMAAFAGLLQAAPAAAQSSLGLDVAGVAYAARHRIQFQGTVGELTGLWFGGAGRARLGPLAVEARGLMGKLGGDVTTTNPERTVRVSSLAAQFAATKALLLGVAMEARRFETGSLVSVWKLTGAAVRVTPSFGVRGVTGVIDARFFPSVSVSGDQKMGTALQAQLGIEYVMPGSGISVSVGYRLERYDFKETGGNPARLEQVAGLTVGLGLRLGR